MGIRCPVQSLTVNGPIFADSTTQQRLSSHRIENRTPKIRLPAYTIRPAIGRDGRFNPVRISPGFNELDAVVMALADVSISSQSITLLDFSSKGTTLINAGKPGKNLRMR